MLCCYQKTLFNFFAVLKAGRIRVLFLPQAVLPDLGFSVSPQCLLESPVRQTCHNLLHVAVAAGFWKCSTFLYFYRFFFIIFFLHSLTVDCKPVPVSHLVLFNFFVMKISVFFFVNLLGHFGVCLLYNKSLWANLHKVTLTLWGLWIPKKNGHVCLNVGQMSTYWICIWFTVKPHLEVAQNGCRKSCKMFLCLLNSIHDRSQIKKIITDPILFNFSS